MSQNFQTQYQPLGGQGEGSGGGLDPEQGERDEDLSPDPHSGSMLFHVVPKSSKSRWNHIEDLDSFFTRVYQYHQNSGFLCMVLQHVLELGQFIFIMWFTSFLFTCVDYDVLFRNKLPVHNDTTDKVKLADVVRSSPECLQHYTWKMVLVLLMASLFWLLRLGHTCFLLFHFWEMKQFFNGALGITDQDLGNTTWEEVEQRVMEVQVEQRMCIHKEVLTELDIYHRILRFTNYLVAMVNKNILPLKFEVPVAGELVFLTKGLRFNIELVMFWSPRAPFRKLWHLSDEYKRLENRQELADDLSKQFLYVGIANLVLFPFIFIFQILYSFFNYAEKVKREPGTLGVRRWSHYGELYLRHFNELDHELSARLSRGYKAASQYMKIFSSPVFTVVAKHLAFVCGSVAAVLALLAIYDEDVLQVEHLLMIMAIFGVVATVCHNSIPDENLVFCPELLMQRVLGEVHYLPDAWREKAHTTWVRHEFSQLFQYRITHMLEELVSPIVTPLILMFRLRHRALDVVDFLRNFTVEVVGVGDVCSFAQMDVRRHGSPTWQPDGLAQDLSQSDVAAHRPEMATDGGKTELSLLHFTMTNPKWKPPQESTAFLSALRTQAQREVGALTTLQEEAAFYTTSLSSVSGGAGTLGLGATSVLQPRWRGGVGPTSMQFQQSLWAPMELRGRMSRVEGSRHGPGAGLMSSTQQLEGEGAGGLSSLASEPMVDPVLGSTFAPVSLMERSSAGPPLPQDLTAVDMSLSTLYLHQLHQRRRHRTAYTDTPHHTHPREQPRPPPTQPPAALADLPRVSFQQAQEKTPLLGEP